MLIKSTLEKDSWSSREDTSMSVTEIMLKYPIPLGFVSSYRLPRNAACNYPHAELPALLQPVAARSSPYNIWTRSRVAETRDCSSVAKWTNPPRFGEEQILQHEHHCAVLDALGAGEHLPGFSTGEAARETPSSHLNVFMCSVIFERP